MGVLTGRPDGVQHLQCAPLELGAGCFFPFPEQVRGLSSVNSPPPNNHKRTCRNWPPSSDGGGKAAWGGCLLDSPAFQALVFRYDENWRCCDFGDPWAGGLVSFDCSGGVETWSGDFVVKVHRDWAPVGAAITLALVEKASAIRGDGDIRECGVVMDWWHCRRIAVFCVKGGFCREQISMEIAGFR
jgi:hypothetical protein